MSGSGAATALASAQRLVKSGDLSAAAALMAQALTAHGDSVPLLAFSALVAARSGKPAEAAALFRRQLMLTPNDRAAQINLAMALFESGALDEALIAARQVLDPRTFRIAAYVHQERGRLAEAVQAYREAVRLMPADFQSWNNLGNLLQIQGETDAAINAFEQSITHRRDNPHPYLNLSELLAQADRPQPRLIVMREAVRHFPRDPKILVELGLAEASERNFEAAERAFRSALSGDPGCVAAYLELGMLYENLNRVEALVELAREAESRGLPAGEAAFLRAWAERRQGNVEAALNLAESVPETIHPVRRNQLIAELADRVGDTSRAFRAYRAMNAAAIAARPQAQQRADGFRDELSAIEQRLADLPRRPPADALPADDPEAPVFIVGFPRSGTTLLDTLLMNHPALHVLEEQPLLHQAELAAGGALAFAELTPEAIQSARDRYFETLAAIAPQPEGRRIVDKFPLSMARLGLVQRLFPAARIVFVERHPCDAVLSCFMANFQLNRAMANFTSLERTAEIYDLVSRIFLSSLERLPIAVHRVRYERMIEDLEGEMRPLTEFLGLGWDDGLLDNEGAAARRGHIRTASYSQVTEPLYRRALGRWERYRVELAPVLPLLSPWAARMGYDI